MFFIITILVSIVSFVLLKHWLNLQKYKEFPGPGPRWPIIGNGMLLVKENAPVNIGILRVLKRLAKQYQKYDLFCMFLGPQPIVYLCGADAVQALLLSDNIMKAPEYRFTRPITMDGIGASSGGKWKERRRLMTPAFHFNILKRFVTIFNKEARVAVEKFRQRSGNFIDVFDVMSTIALKLICETSFGYELKPENVDDRKYIDAIMYMKESIMARFFNPFYWNDFIYNRTESGKKMKIHFNNASDFLDRVIRERKKLFEDGNFDQLLEDKKVKLSFLDLFIKIQKETGALNDMDMKEEVQNIMFAGFDTTANSLGWAFFVLGNHIDIQDKLREEIKSFKTNENDDFTIEDFNEMKYMDAFVKENLRLYANPPIIGRTLANELKVKEYTIPKGAVVYVNMYGLHRDDRVFPDPEKFNPEHFLTETNRSKYAYVPFSAGLRTCIGMRYAVLETKVILAHIVRNLHILSFKKETEVEHSAQITLYPVNGVQIKFTPFENVA